MSIATIDDRTITRCEVHIPAWGIWWADVELDEPEQLAGATVISIGGLTLNGTIMSGGLWQGRARYRVAGGAGGWGASISARAYTSDIGVKLRTVINDAATACGESFEASTASGTVGPHYARESGPAARVLQLLAPRGWYVGEDGTTRLGARIAAVFDDEYTVIQQQSAEERLEIAADDIQSLVPGAVVEGIQAVDVVHRVDDETLRSTIYGAKGGTGSTRILTAIERVVLSMTTHLRYQGVWSYRVVSQTGERLDLQAERSSSGMPDLLRVRVRPGVPGCKAEWASGSLCLVAFVDGEPSRPVVVAGDDPDSPGHIPDELYMDSDGEISLGAGLGRVIREGDSFSLAGVQPGPGATGCSALLTLGLGAPPAFSKVKA